MSSSIQVAMIKVTKLSEILIINIHEEDPFHDGCIQEYIPAVFDNFHIVGGQKM